MRSIFVVLAAGCALIASDAISQTLPSTSLQAFPPPFRVPQPADINPNPTSRKTVSTEQTELNSSRLTRMPRLSGLSISEPR